MSEIKNMNAQLVKAGTAKGIFSLDFVADRCVKNYQAVTGRKDAKNWYQSEVLAMMTIFAEKPDLAKSDPLSIWGCMMTAARTGLSIADGHLDLVQYGTILKAEANYKGMREQLKRMEEIKFIHEAQVVHNDDELIHDKLNNRLEKHIVKGTPKNFADIKAAYVRVEFTDGHVVDVVMYAPELASAKDRSKNKSEYGPWQKTPWEMCKKTVIKRAKKIYFRPTRWDIEDEKMTPIPETEDVPHEEVKAETPAPETQTEAPLVETEEVKPEKKKEKPKARTSMDDLLNND